MPNIKELLETGCEITIGNLRFYKLPDNNGYRMIYFDEKMDLIQSKEKNFNNIDECVTCFMEYYEGE